MDGFDELIAYAMGELEPEDAAALERRLAVDPRAALSLEAVTEVIAALRSRAGAGPAPSVVAQIKAAFGVSGPHRARPTVRPGPMPGRTAGLSHVAASALLDTRERVALAGFRGEGDGYQLVLTSEAADIDIQVRGPREPGHPWVVLGQIEQEGMELRGTVFVWRPGEEEVTWETESDEFGVFRLELPRGKYHISVLVGSVAVRLPPLDIG